MTFTLGPLSIASSYTHVDHAHELLGIAMIVSLPVASQ